MPANWDDTQHLSHGRVEWPTGPIEGLVGAERPMWIQAWVVQGGPPDDPNHDAGFIYQGPSQSCNESSWFGWVPNQWTAAEPGWVNGALQPGGAVGIAIMAVRNDSGPTPTYKFEWWHEAIILMSEV